MMKEIAVIVVFAVVAASAVADSSYSSHSSTPVVQQPRYNSVPARYNYRWDVTDQYSGNFYGQHEQRNGDNTRGMYYVRLPDSRLMRVQYYADSSGYHPTITFEGEAQGHSAPARGYSRPAHRPARRPAQEYTQPARVLRVPVQLYRRPRK